MAVDPNIQKKADDIRTKVYGKEVREGLASGLEEMSSDVVENEGRQSVVEGRQDSVESQWQAVSDEMTDKDVISAPEIIAARNGEANLKARLDKEKNEVTAQLAQTEREAQTLRFRDGLTTTASFLVDDGYIGDYDILKPISEQTGVPFTLSVVTNDMDNDDRIFSHAHMDKLHELVDDYGFEVASHTQDHLRLSDESYETQENQLKLSKDRLEEYGFYPKSIVYPYGAYNEDTLKIAPKYYSHGFRAGTNGINDSPIETYLLHRIQFDQTNPNNNFEWYKDRIDEANAQNKWIVFMLHTSPHLNWLDTAQQQLLVQVINYMKSLDIPIKTTYEAYLQFRNIYETADGRYTLGAKPNQEYLPNNIEISENTPLNSFPFGVSYKYFITADTNNFPDSRAGILTTYNWLPGWAQSYQLWKPYSNNTIYIRRPLTKDTWGDFEAFSPTINVPRVTWETGAFSPFETKKHTQKVDGISGVSFVLVNPINLPLPEGILFNSNIDTSGNLTITLTNTTDKTINNFARNWNIKIIIG